ncbi:hypothetical protein Tco_0182407, partial [Tanacetum coccineum]
TPPVDWLSTTVDRWSGGGPAVVWRWSLTCHVVAMWRATSWRLANQRLPRGTTNDWVRGIFMVLQVRGRFWKHMCRASIGGSGYIAAGNSGTRFGLK